MRVLLIKPPTNNVLGLEAITLAEPLGLECIAGAVALEKHECLIVDMRLDGISKGMSKSRKFAPDLIGVQCNFTTERMQVLKLLDLLNNDFPGIPIIVGGHDASRDPEWFRHPAITAVGIGDGEEILPAFLQAIEENYDFKSVSGLMINTPNGSVFTEPLKPRKNADDLPMPNRQLVRSYSERYYLGFRRPMALLETARGCPFRCNFCSVWKYHNSSYREKSVDRVLKELNELNAPNVFITDDIFWNDTRRAEALASAIRSSGIKRHYWIQTRTDIIVRHPELVRQWKELGSLTVFLGLEKLDDESLKSINKRNSASNNNKAIEILKDLGAGYTANFIIDPDWDADDFSRLKEWVAHTDSYNSAFSVLTPLPGTDLWNDVQDKLTTHDWELFDLQHAVIPTKLPLDEFYSEYAGLWKHAAELRSRSSNLMKSGLHQLSALATGKVNISTLRKGISGNKILGDAETFLSAHEQS